MLCANKLPTRIMPVAIFDLDKTLLSGDSDHAWGLYLAEIGIVDRELHEREQERYYAAYLAGTLDIDEFLRFQLRALRDNPVADLERWRAEFLVRKIQPMITAAARELVELHRRRGDTLLIVTATNRFITEPIAAEFSVHHLLATEPARENGRFTGAVSGIPCYRQGKLEHLHRWLEDHDEDLADSWCYSDSHNDLPLLRAVANPVAVNPDQVLATTAQEEGWPVLDLGS